MSVTALSPFTPSLMYREVLEALFVQREELLGRIVDLVRESADTDSKHQQLIVGAAGLGKSHLAAMAYHRLAALESIDIAWLGEEEWGVTSFLDLLLRILDLLGHGDAPDEMAAGELLKERIGEKTLLLIVENLEELFKGLGLEGQTRLRAFMQENPFITMLATTPSLFDGISKRTEPFYGTFSIYHLQPLTFEETASLLAKMAAFRGDEDLAGFIETAEAEGCIRAFHHLSRGNHRLCALFARHLDRYRLGDFVEPMVLTIDDLTPQFSSWMDALPPQPRKIVDFLCRHRSCASVGEIARRCFLKHQTASSQLKLLKDRGYVEATSVGRESFYEIRDPLMRLCSGLKRDRGESMRNVAEFLRHWYAGEDDRSRRVRSLLTESNSPEHWFQGAMDLLDTAKRDGRMPSLATGIARSAAALQDHFVSTEGARIWLGVWKKVGMESPELQLALRLLDAAVRILEKPDDRIPLSLAREERKILSDFYLKLL